MVGLGLFRVVVFLRVGLGWFRVYLRLFRVGWDLFRVGLGFSSAWLFGFRRRGAFARASGVCGVCESVSQRWFRWFRAPPIPWTSLRIHGPHRSDGRLVSSHALPDSYHVLIHVRTSFTNQMIVVFFDGFDMFSTWDWLSLPLMFHIVSTTWGVPEMGVPQNRWFIRENPSINGWWFRGTPLFEETSIWIYTYMGSPNGSSLKPPVNRPREAAVSRKRPRHFCSGPWQTRCDSDEGCSLRSGFWTCGGVLK